MSELPNEVQNEILALIGKNKETSLSWLSKVTQISEDDLIENAFSLGLVVVGDNILTIEDYQKKITKKSKSRTEKITSQRDFIFCPNCSNKLIFLDGSYDLKQEKYCKYCSVNIPAFFESVNMDSLKLIKCYSCGKPTFALQKYCINCAEILIRSIETTKKYPQISQRKYNLRDDNPLLYKVVIISSIIGLISLIIMMTTFWGESTSSGWLFIISFSLTIFLSIVLLISTLLIRFYRYKHRNKRNILIP